MTPKQRAKARHAVRLRETMKIANDLLSELNTLYVRRIEALSVVINSGDPVALHRAGEVLTECDSEAEIKIAKRLATAMTAVIALRTGGG